MATKVTRFTTHYLVNEPGLGLFDVVDDLSTIEYKTEEKIRLGYIFDKETDTVRIPVGVGDDYIKSVFNVDEIHQGTVTPFLIVITKWLINLQPDRLKLYLV